MINKNNYKEQLKGISVIEISGESCANCLSLMPVLNSIVSKRTDCRLVNIEATEETSEIIKMFEVDRVPTILLCDDGEVFARATGFQPEEILELWIDAKISEHFNKK